MMGWDSEEERLVREQEGMHSLADPVIRLEAEAERSACSCLFYPQVLDATCIHC